MREILKKNNIFYFILQITTTDRQFSTKNKFPLCKNPTKRSDFIKIFFYFILRITKTERRFLQKNECPFLRETMEGSYCIKKYLLFLFCKSQKHIVDFIQKTKFRFAKNTLMGSILLKIFVILFCKSPRQSVDFLQKIDGHRAYHLT